MMEKPLVSVVMNCRNSEKYLKEAIDSVYRQTYSNWEIIFFDNCSTDRTPEIAKSYDKRLKYFRSTDSLSLGEARNQALECATGQFLSFLDGDDRWFPNKLERQLFEFDDERVGLAFSNGYNFNLQGEKILFFLECPPVGQVFNNLIEHYYFSLVSVMLSRESLKSMDHLFDPQFEIVEEADLFIRISRQWQCAYVEEPLVEYRMHQNSITNRSDERRYIESKKLLDKLIHLYPDMMETCPEAIQTWRDCDAHQLGVYYWKNGQGLSGRKVFKEHFSFGVKFFVLYGLSFFPYSFVKFFHKFFKKTVLPT